MDAAEAIPLRSTSKTPWFHYSAPNAPLHDASPEGTRPGGIEYWRAELDGRTGRMSRLSFQLQAQAPGSAARAAVFQTLHGEVQTPIFMPVGTQATVKSQTVQSLRETGSRVLLANTYHLLLRPGPEVFERFGGIHRFMNWNGPVLTDSGGFQIFSLPHSRRMNEDGALFQSYVDGKMHLLSPEASIKMQRAIGSDIMMVLDQCIPSTADHAQASAAMELTHRWAKRSLDARGDSPQSLFGIVQGACFEDLRKQSVQALCEMSLDGFAIGGLAVGETKSQREDFTALTASLLRRDLPRYLMGVGTPIDILEAVHRGVDMFDCILPSQVAQRGTAYTSEGRLQLRRIGYKFSDEPLDPLCDCTTCREYSRGYLHHLYKTGEMVGWKLLTSHNLTFYHRFMGRMRQHILEGTFLDYYKSQREIFARSDNTELSAPPPAKKRVRPLTLGDYEVHDSGSGFASIRQVSSGEVMHSVSDPTEEAHRLYIAQSHLAELLAGDETEPLVIWDVGLGAATNAMAAIRCFESGARRPLQILSFECDLNPLKLALLHPERFPYLKHAAPYVLAKQAAWRNSDGRLEWKLLEGDFLETFTRAALPDLIFFDPFSAKTDSGMWTSEAFARVARQTQGKPFRLYTYSASTAVRVAMLSAGLYVARGVATGPKSETTVASNRRDEFRMPTAGLNWLDEKWLQRWSRSDAKYPGTLADEQRSAFEKRILGHPQFSFENRGA